MSGPQLIDYGNPVSDHPLNRGLAAWWLALPTNAGGGTLFDLTGRSPGTLTNGPAWAAGPAGAVGPAVSLDGSNDKVVLAGTLPTAGGYTVAVWCRPASTSAGAHNLFCGGGAANYGVQLRRDGANWNLYHKFSSDRNATDTGGVTAGRDTFAAGTWDGAAITLYVDGWLRQQTSGPTGLDYSPTVCRLGCDDNDAGGNIQFWDGLIWDVRWYARGLSAAEVQGLYDQGRRGHPDTLRRYAPRAWLFAPASGGGGVTGDASATQAADTGTSAGTVLVTGSASSTQAAQTGTSAGAVAVAGAGAATQAVQTGSAAGAVIVAGAGSATQGSQTGTAAGTVAVAGAAGQSQAAQAGTATGAVLVTGTASQTQAANIGSAAGLVVSGPVGDGAATQAAQTGSAAGTVLVSGAGAKTQAGQTGSAAGTVSGGSPITGVAAITQAAQTGSAAGFLGDEPPAGRRDVFRSRVFGSSVFGGPAA